MLMFIISNYYKIKQNHAHPETKYEILDMQHKYKDTIKMIGNGLFSLYMINDWILLCPIFKLYN